VRGTSHRASRRRPQLTPGSSSKSRISGKKFQKRKAELATALGRGDGLDDANLMLRSAVAPEIGAPCYIPLGLSGAFALLIADS
jgi:hypothetical protein